MTIETRPIAWHQATLSSCLLSNKEETALLAAMLLGEDEEAVLSSMAMLWDLFDEGLFPDPLSEDDAIILKVALEITCRGMPNLDQERTIKWLSDISTFYADALKDIPF